MSPNSYRAGWRFTICESTRTSATARMFQLFVKISRRPANHDGPGWRLSAPHMSDPLRPDRAGCAPFKTTISTVVFPQPRNTDRDAWPRQANGDAGRLDTDDAPNDTNVPAP